MWLGEFDQGAGAEECGDWQRSAPGGLWTGRTAVGSGSAPLSGWPVASEACHLRENGGKI